MTFSMQQGMIIISKFWGGFISLGNAQPETNSVPRGSFSHFLNRSWLWTHVCELEMVLEGVMKQICEGTFFVVESNCGNYITREDCIRHHTTLFREV